MKISEICSLCAQKITLVREGCFDTVRLVNKEQNPPGVPAITYVGDVRYVDAFLAEDNACVICTEEVRQVIEPVFSGGIAVSDEPKTSFFELHNHIAEHRANREENVIDPTVQIHPTAIIEDSNIRIGKNTVICARAIIKRGTVIGEDCVIREGVIVGTPGFYYYGTGAGKKLVTSAGGVRIGNNVDLHPQTVIEKGVLYGNTTIGNNTKIDNLTLIGHDSQIGENCIIAAGTTFAGGVSFHDGAFAGVGVTIAPYVTVCEDAKLSSGAVATKTVNAHEHVSGNFAIDHKRFLQNLKASLADQDTAGSCADKRVQ